MLSCSHDNISLVDCHTNPGVLAIPAVDTETLVGELCPVTVTVLESMTFRLAGAFLFCLLNFSWQKKKLKHTYQTLVEDKKSLGI